MSALVFDTEGNGLIDTCTNFWCVSTQNVNGGEINSYSVDHSYPSIIDGFEELKKADTIIGHNIIAHDLPLMEKLSDWIPKEKTDIVDTLVLSRLGSPDRTKPSGYTGKGGPHSLECWGYRVCRAKPHHEDWSVYSAAMLERNREDVGINRLTYNRLSSEFAGHDWSEAIELEHNVARIISKQSRYGVLFDAKKAIDICEKIETKINKISEKITPGLPVSYIRRGISITKPFLNSGGYRKSVTDWYGSDFVNSSHVVGGPFTRVEEKRIDLNSSKQIKEYLLTQGWKPTQWNFKDGLPTSPKLTEDSYDSITGDLGKQIGLRNTLRHKKSQIEGWITRLRDDGRLSADANTCGTPTGRFRHINVVNVPKVSVYPKKHPKAGTLVWSDDPEYQSIPFGTEMRSFFIVPEGYVLIGHDASGLELRMLAHYMNDEDFIQELLYGDIHESNRIAAGLDTRDQAKTFIYAFLYGAGDAKIGSIVKGTEKDGKALKKQFLQSLPALDRLIKRVKKAADKGWLKGLDNRKLMMRRNADGKLQKNKALNTLLQGAGAIVMKKSMVLLDEWVIKEQLDANKVLDMHDEGQAEVLIAHQHKYKELAEQSIVQAGVHFNLNIPLAADVKIGKNWAETH